MFERLKKHIMDDISTDKDYQEFFACTVRRTGFCGTRRIFRGPRCADNYLMLIQEPEHPERDLIVEDVFSIVLDHIAIFDVFNLFLPFLSPANLKGLSVNLKI